MLSPDATPSTVRTPKRGAAKSQSRGDWFNYYAGFSAEFVEDAIEALNLDQRSILLDPWLGGGTTGEIATATGVQFRGYDLNPSVLLVAKARTYRNEKGEKLSDLVRDVASTYKRKIQARRKTTIQRVTDPLEQWLQPSSASAFRTLESIIAQFNRRRSVTRPTWTYVSEISPLRSVLYVALFRTLRRFISDYGSSNPTWIKLPNGGRRVQVSDKRILCQFLKEIAFLQDAIEAETRLSIKPRSEHCSIRRASSTALPLESSSVDAILSSPPYCTRIDYVRATLPELALVGFPSGHVLQELRNKMMGTPTITTCAPMNNSRWGSACNAFLSRVEKHQSKASSTYYIKYFRQYFRSAFDSLVELNRVLKKSGSCILVVQDSYYKDVLNDLPLIFSEMAFEIGWHLTKKLDFPVVRTFAGIHPQSKQYRTDFKAIESVLIFRK
jgi:DNA modification methylase